MNTINILIGVPLFAFGIYATYMITKGAIADFKKAKKMLGDLHLNITIEQNEPFLKK